MSGIARRSSHLVSGFLFDCGDPARLFRVDCAAVTLKHLDANWMYQH
jgi:hypothetical protein